MASEPVDGTGPGADDFAQWDDYVPEGVFISEERRQELRREQERYLAERDRLRRVVGASSIHE